MKPSYINVYTESNPNPNSLKFVLNFNLVEAQYDFPTKESAKHSPLAADLYNEFDFIEGVFLAANFITLTKNQETDWFEVQSEVRDFIKKYFTDNKPVVMANAPTVSENNTTETDAVEDDETVKRIKVVLEEYVRPAVEQDGGAINFHSFDEGVVKVILQGACSGCPSSTVTLKSGIENLLTRMVPEVKEVVAEGV